MASVAPNHDDPTSSPRPVCQIFTPLGMLGYGFSLEEMHDTLSSLKSELPHVPTAMIVDSGSTDSGPKKLALGDMTCPRSSYKQNLAGLLDGVREYSVPLLIGSAGGAGINAHVDELTDMVRELSEEKGQSLKVIQIFAEIDKALIHQRLNDNAITGCGSAVPQLQPNDIDESTVIVAQMGPEPFRAAMDQHSNFDVIIAGRAYDPSPYVAFAQASLQKLDPTWQHRDPEHKARVEGGFMHLGKIMECGGHCAVPKSHGAVGVLYEDGSFDIRPTLLGARCTRMSVAAHTLYEKSRPDILSGPGGWLDVGEAKYYDQPDGKTIRVRGSKFFYSVDQKLPYQVKLEGARNRGYRSMYMGFVRDPILIDQIDNMLVHIKEYAGSHTSGLQGTSWDLEWHVYGRDNNGKTPSELFLVGESRAETQEFARSIVSSARIATIHAPYPGQKATSGNFGFGIGGVNEVDLGLCCEFCVYHLMSIHAGEETSLFQIKAVRFDNNAATAETPTARTATNGAVTSQQARRQGQPASTTSQQNTADLTTLGGVARVLRSKNSGPYEITFDVIFDSQEVFQAVRDSNLLTQSTIEGLYGLAEGEVVWCGFFAPALAFKATIPRRRNGINTASGGYLEDDVHGSQMYTPLARLPTPDHLQKTLQVLIAG